MNSIIKKLGECIGLIHLFSSSSIRIRDYGQGGVIQGVNESITVGKIVSNRVFDVTRRIKQVIASIPTEEYSCTIGERNPSSPINGCFLLINLCMRDLHDILSSDNIHMSELIKATSDSMEDYGGIMIKFIEHQISILKFLDGDETIRPLGMNITTDMIDTFITVFDKGSWDDDILKGKPKNEVLHRLGSGALDVIKAIIGSNDIHTFLNSPPNQVIRGIIQGLNCCFFDLDDILDIEARNQIRRLCGQLTRLPIPISGFDPSECAAKFKGFSSTMKYISETQTGKKAIRTRWIQNMLGSVGEAYGMMGDVQLEDRKNRLAYLDNMVSHVVQDALEFCDGYDATNYEDKCKPEYYRDELILLITDLAKTGDSTRGIGDVAKKYLEENCVNVVNISPDVMQTVIKILALPDETEPNPVVHVSGLRPEIQS